MYYFKFTTVLKERNEFFLAFWSRKNVEFCYRRKIFHVKMLTEKL